MSALAIKQSAQDVVFQVKLVPASSKTQISGLLDGMLKVKVSAAPEKGKANDCLVKFLAKTLGVKKNAVTIVSGLSSPVKQIKISDVLVEHILGKLDV